MPILRGAVALLLAAAWLVSLAGLLAPLWPQAEIVNHFRLYILAACLFVALLAWLTRQRRATRAGLAAGAFNAAMVVAVLAVAPPAPSSSDSDGKRLTLVSFNAWVGNTRYEDVTRFLRRTDADVVFLQEMDADNAETIVPSLADLYPHVLSCVDVPHCGLVLMSRRPWEQASSERAADGKPRIMRIRYGDDLAGLEIVGTHFAVPYQAELQARNVAWFTSYAETLAAPAIVVGDLNLTPWSWQLTRLSMRTGLRRIGTWRHSWPAPGTVKDIPFSLFLIDHAFVTGGVSLESWRTGPALGSDHRPVIARFSIEAAQER